jgi:hypothetical protein
MRDLMTSTTALSPPTSLSVDRYGAVLAFLKGAFAGHPIGVAELEVTARATMLLGERQSITHAKLFRRAKRALGIRSIRDGFGARGEWFWLLPDGDPGSNVAEPAGYLSPNQSPAVIYGEPGPEPTQGHIGVPPKWIEGIAKLDRHRAPPHVPLHLWRRFIGDCERFLDPNAIWAAEAAAMGWDAPSLFGCAPTQPLAHMQVAGLIWALRGRKIVRLYPDWASIEDSADGSRYVFNRRATFRAPITLPWKLR